MSDAVKVTGMCNNTPKVQFMYRVNRTINLAEEKTTEKALQIAVENTCKEMGIVLADFSVYPNTDVTPNRYDFLIDFNEGLRRLVAELLDVDTPVSLATTFEPLSPLPQPDVRPYYQVFAQRLGFQADLSIADLLFNLGPEGLLYLTNSQK
jgi:hypothetical protein